MTREIGGTEDGAGLRAGVVVARFNAFITERLLAGARAALRECGVADGDVTVVRVPGAFEVPLVAQRLASSGEVDVIVCLGAVIRGGTPHFEYVSRAVTDGIGRVMLEFGIPVAFGILTTDTVEQAVDRSGEGADNKGAEAVRTAIEMARVLEQLPGRGDV
ncbi:MAG: 6,7-dimethyl-8-ribityllumazine synthase [Candidatus Binatota bacterium]|jgi:6,7-dimethyl-8-ribityllumazine synthase|nr:6,7-dimethyl-8-ribityllumazine synthase [Candidatus Binatota bacterium]